MGRRTQGFNAFLVRSIGVFVPVALPLLLLFGVWDHPVLYLLPSMPGVLLLKASFEPIADWQYVYSYGYLLLALALTYFWGKKLITLS